MRALVVYESYFGNTRDVALAIARGLGSVANVEVEALEVGQAPVTSRGIDLLVVGGPIHAWGMPRPSTRADALAKAGAAHVDAPSHGPGVREWLATLTHPVPGPRAAVFDTAMRTSWFPVGNAGTGEARALERSGALVVAAPEHFYVTDTRGPLVDGELARAERWGATLVDAQG